MIILESEKDDYKNTLKMLAQKRQNEIISPSQKAVIGRGLNAQRRNDTESNEVKKLRARQRFKNFVRSPAFKAHVKVLSDRSKNLVNHLTGEFQFKTIEKPLTISFDGLNLDLKSDGKPILQNIFGKFQPFNITALMG